MFRIPAIKEIVDKAKQRAPRWALNGSITGGQGNLCGAVFEVAHKTLFGGEFSTGESKYQYDIHMPQGWFRGDDKYKQRLECKAKRRTLGETDLHWDASIADDAGMGVNQQCDTYTFSSVSMSGKNPRWIWFMGLATKEEYLCGQMGDQPQDNEVDSRGRKVRRWNDLADGAEFRRKGLPYDNNGFDCSENCWNRPYGYLTQYELDDIPEKRRSWLQIILKCARQQGWGGSDDFLLGQEPELQRYLPGNLAYV